MQGKSKLIQIYKSTEDTELMQATFVVLVPDEVDLHGDTVDEATVRAGCHNFNLFCRKANLFHMQATTSFDIVESYVAPVDMQIGDKFVTKGTWLATVQANTEDVWQAIKSGIITGLSIGAMAEVHEVETE